MRRIALALITTTALAFTIALTADLAHAVLDTASFTPVRMELEHRASNDYSGTLTKALRKEQKAVEKSLVLLDKPSTNYAKDASTGKKITKLLRRAFKAEFAATDPAKVAELPPTLQATANGLADSVRDQLNSVIADLPTVPENKARKVQKQLDRANAALDAAGSATQVTKQFAKVGSAAKAAATARKLVDKFGDGSGPSGDGMAALVDGSEFSSSFAQAEYATGDKALQIFGTTTLQSGEIITIFVTVRGVMNPGSYPLNAQNAKGQYQVRTPPQAATIYDLVPGSGVLTVEELDLVTPRVRASFSFQALNGQLGTVEITDGVHNVSEEFSVRSGNGF